MKTRIISITIILTLIFTIINTGQDIYAANKKVYEFAETDCIKFVKLNGELKIKVVKEWGNGMHLNDADGYRTIDKQKLELTLAKNCKWSWSNAGKRKYFKSSYKKIKSDMENARTEFLKDGSYSSPGNVQIIVRNGKVARVNVCYS